MLGGGTLLPVHWGTFNLGLHDWDEPAETLLQLGEQRGVRLLTPRLGSVMEPDHVERATPWWREVPRARHEPVLAEVHEGAPLFGGTHEPRS